MTIEMWYVIVMYFVGVAAGILLGITLERDRRMRRNTTNEDT